MRKMFYDTNLINAVAYLLGKKDLDIQDFKYKDKNDKIVVSFRTYNDSNDLTNLDSINLLKIKFTFYKNVHIPGILEFGKYKQALDDYESKRILLNILNKVYYIKNSVSVDKIADRFINDYNNYEHNMKKNAAPELVAMEARPEQPMPVDEMAEDAGNYEEDVAYDDSGDFNASM